MAFHVEIRRSVQRAWAFNLDEARLQTLLDPWRREEMVDFGDKEWDPRTSKLTILEGPELAGPELSFGQGWNNAERTGTDVTGRMLAAPAAGESLGVAVLAESEDARGAVTEMLAEAGLAVVDWSDLRARLIAAAAAAAEGSAQSTGPLALIVFESAEPAADWLFEAGLALGALGGRAIVAQLGGATPPPQLRELAIIRLDPQQPASRLALSERLRHAGLRSG
jgi:hypothetical protein